MAASTDKDEYRIELLQGSSNYRTWKFSMKMLLQAKDLWELVSGEELKPDDDDDVEKVSEWNRKARRAMAVIALSMTGAEKEHVIDCDTPKQAWDILEKLYEGKGRNRKFMLLQELFRMSMETSGSMDVYLRSIREIMSELLRTGIKLEDDVKLAIIFNGLPEKYRYLIVAIEQGNAAIDFDELTARLLEEEKKVDPDAGKTAMAARRFQVRCFNCNELGHVKADCPRPRKKLEAKSAFAM